MTRYESALSELAERISSTEATLTTVIEEIVQVATCRS